MTPELKAQLEKQADEADAKAEELWLKLKQAEADMEPYRLRMEAIRHEWHPLYSRADALHKLLEES